MTDFNQEDGMFTTIQNVPSWMSDNAIAWHNQVTGDDWNGSYVKHPDIQHRIGNLVDACSEYEVIDGKVVYTEADLF